MKRTMSMTLAALLALGAFGGGLAVGANTQLAPVTKKDLLDAMHGEAFAYAKYMAYAKQAHEHGNTTLATLYEHTANIELNAHFATHAQEYGLVDRVISSHELNRMRTGFGAREEAAA